MKCARGVMDAQPAIQREGGSSNLTLALQDIRLFPISFIVARAIVVIYHYLHSMAGGTQLCFGVFAGSRLLGALVLGCGPAYAYRLVKGATRDDCMTLTRLWLSDELPPNSESRVIGALIRALRKHTSLKFLISYADPSVGTLAQSIKPRTGFTRACLRLCPFTT